MKSYQFFWILVSITLNLSEMNKFIDFNQYSYIYSISMCFFFVKNYRVAVCKTSRSQY